MIDSLRLSISAYMDASICASRLAIVVSVDQMLPYIRSVFCRFDPADPDEIR